MADFEEPKEFAFGDLNPVQKPRAAKSADPSSMSILDVLKEVAITHYTPDATKGTGPYKGIVLRVEEEMSQNEPAPGNWLSTVFGKQGMFGGLFTAPKKLKRYKVRIPEIHVTLPSPKKYAQDPNEKGDHQKIINMYPTFIAHDSNVEGAGPGDLVWVDYGSKENFDDPTYIGPVFPPPDSSSGGSGGSGDGASGSDAFGDCGGGSGLSGASGGSLTAPNVPITDPSIKWKNGMYLSPKQTSKRNKQDPMGTNKSWSTSASNFDKVKAYVSAGGSGRAASGKLALGSCQSINNNLAKYLTALRIACEDQADRGYKLGGKTLDPVKGGIDCSGFTNGVRSVMEFMIDASMTKEAGGYEIDAGEKTNYRSWIGKGVRPWYGNWTKPKRTPQRHKDGWDWVDPCALVKATLDGRLEENAVSNKEYYNDYLKKVRAGELGGIETAKPTNYFDVGESNVHLMPGDVLTLSKTEAERPSWCSNTLVITHILVLFADPDGNLRIAESGGDHGGTGSKPVHEYLAKSKSLGRKIWVWQYPEWTNLWQQLGGRPNEPWTPELCKKLAGEEYFGAPSLAKAATEDGVATETVSEDGTTTEKKADAVGTKLEPKITVENITRAQALTESTTQEEKDEIMALPADSSSAQMAATAAGKRAIEKSLEEAKTPASTPATESTAAQNTTPSPAPVPVATCGGGSYTPGQPFTIGADRAGTPIGNVPFIGTLGEVRTNPKMKVIKSPVDFDIQDGGKSGPWYSKNPRMREDVAANLVEVRNIVKELGGQISSSGARRLLSTKVTKGRSATSFHYTGLAVDLLLPHTAKKPERDIFIVEHDTSVPGKKRFIVWAKSSKTSGVVDKGQVKFEVEHKTLNAIREKNGQPPVVEPMTGYFVNITKIMMAYGLEGIGPVGKSWYQKSAAGGASEAWHFDFRNNAGLTTGSTTFGMVLETFANPSTDPPWREAGRVWRGGYFGK